MTPPITDISTLESHLWEAAIILRTKSNYASNKYFVPVMGYLAEMNTEMTG